MTSSHSIKRILIVRTDRLGDVILTLPMLPALRNCFPDAYIAMLLRRYTGEVIEENPYVDELLWYDEDTDLVALGTMKRRLQEKRFDAAIVVYPRFRLAWLIFAAGIPLRIGTGYRFYSFLFNRRVFEHRKDAKKHEVEYNLELLRPLDCIPPIGTKHEFLINIPAEIESRAYRILRDAGADLNRTIVVLHPGTGGSAREWPPVNFGHLALKLNSIGSVEVVVTGAKGEEDKVASVVKFAAGKAIPLVGKLRTKELATVIRSAKLFVANSTGPLHLAVAVGTPVVGLFPQHKPMSAKRWGPYSDHKAVFVPDRSPRCEDCLQSSAAQCDCMASISVDSVFEAALSLMGMDEQRGNSVSHA